MSNTSPLMNLAIIGEVDFLHTQFGEIWILPAVLDELRLDSELPGEAGFWIAPVLEAEILRAGGAL